MTDHPPVQNGRPTTGARVLAYILLFMGAAWMLLSGGCTLTFMTMAAGGFGNGRGDATSVGVFLGIGAVCILPGLALVYGGWVILRGPKKKRP